MHSLSAESARVPAPSALFESQRSRLFGLAYRMLGTVADAEDLVQEAYLRWHTADLSQIRSPEAWLVTAVSRLSIDRLRRVASERALYVGSWLPEPSPLEGPITPEGHLEQSSQLSFAFLVLLQKLSAEERVALLLREAFDWDYPDIASALEKSEAACRQLVHRAHERVHGERTRTAVSLEKHAEVLARFVAALETNDRAKLLELLSPEVTLVSDGGGKVAAARNVIVGPEHVARFSLKLQQKLGSRQQQRVVAINGEPTLLLFRDGALFATTSIAIVGERIETFFRVLNPDKLRHVQRRFAGG